MRPQKVTDQNLIEGLLSVIRSKGYDGSSLNDLANSAGLQKASLYHRFPDGKKEITQAVLTYIEEWVDINIVELLTNKEQNPDERLRSAIENINWLYEGGEKICILRALTMDNNLGMFGTQLKEIMAKWISGFTNLGIAFGYSEKESKSKAEQTLVLVQGSLVVSKAMSTLEPFQKALISVKNMYRSI